jgi:hypothetical protein
VIFHCDRIWVGLIIISTLVMLCAAIITTILSFFRRASDVTDALSALSLNSGIPLMRDGSYLDATQRTRVLKDVRLKLGDACPDEPVGRIVIGQDTGVGDLKKGRLYM